MKKSLIGLYVDNTEVPEYKSAGASGFDLRAKFNPNLPAFSQRDVAAVIAGDKYVTNALYDRNYANLEWVIDFNTLHKSIRHAVNQPIEGKTLLEYMVVNDVGAVNIILPYKTVKFGTVDNDWRGNSGIIVQNPTPFSYIIIPNSRLAQGVIVEKKRAVFDIKSSKDELSKTERGENGFGISGLM